MEEKKFTPTEYFEQLKDKKNSITDADLQKIYSNCLSLLKKYVVTGQVAGAKKLMFHLETIEKEREIVSLGIDTFVYKDDIEDYIDNVADDVVKIIELERYEREIPDEIVEVLTKVKDKFDKFYILFTDYTGKVEKQVAQERRDKDPILFGTLQDTGSRTIIDRFYFIGDWEDEYCDLTLDKLVNQTKHKTGKDITRHIETPMTLDDLKEQVNKLTFDGETRLIMQPSINGIVSAENKKKGFFNNIKTFLFKKDK